MKSWLVVLTSDLEAFFSERRDEVRAYLELLKNIEEETKAGVPRLARTQRSITPDQAKILISNLYLQLYNLVEATVTSCLKTVTDEVQARGILPSELSWEMRREWTKSVARTHEEMGPEKRLEAALDLSSQLMGQLPLSEFRIDSGGGGNWDDTAIEKLFSRLGASSMVSADTMTSAKRHIKDDLGSLALVKNRRNGLAHGSLSFVDCGGEMLYPDMERLTETVIAYLSEVVQSFVDFADGHLTDKIC